MMSSNHFLSVVGSVSLLSAVSVASLVACGGTPADGAQSSSSAVVTVAEPPATGIDQTGWNILTAVHSHKVLDLPAFTHAEGAAMGQWTPNGGLNQQWKLSSPKAGQYQFYSTVSGKALAIQGGSLDDLAPLVQTEPDALDPIQLFYALDAGNGAVTFQNVNSGKCLDVKGASLSNGAPIIQYACNEQDNQRWLLTHVFGD